MIHECLEAIEATCSICPALKDTLLGNTETWSTNGSSYVISGRHAGILELVIDRRMLFLKCKNTVLDFMDLGSNAGLCHLSCTSTAISGIILVKKEGAQEQVLEEMALTNANEKYKAAILSLSTELAPTLDDMLQIPLHPDDAPRFAFSVPTLNREALRKRYHWKFLLQGMKNSPSICQWYLSSLLSPVRAAVGEAIILHYMDDVLVCAPNDDLLSHALDLIRLNRFFGCCQGSSFKRKRLKGCHLGSTWVWRVVSRPLCHKNWLSKITSRP
ncbi:hypothetical protein DUI87_20636 [Hirundo rustica rustica]|uniref:ribonuclease H n=1 Tax=Hirundo rustica rustica TaxID=333673 RepID=A0A3M0JRI8_HIRRU|nr:hypothetical protein DUI87_20636 [Hirundo rustica rustica]